MNGTNDLIYLKTAFDAFLEAVPFTPAAIERPSPGEWGAVWSQANSNHIKSCENLFLAALADGALKVIVRSADGSSQIIVPKEDWTEILDDCEGVLGSDTLAVPVAHRLAIHNGKIPCLSERLFLEWVKSKPNASPHEQSEPKISAVLKAISTLWPRGVGLARGQERNRQIVDFCKTNKLPIPADTTIRRCLRGIRAGRWTL